MNFPLFVSFPTKQQHPSAAAAHAGRLGARVGGGAGVREGGHVNIKIKVTYSAKLAWVSRSMSRRRRSSSNN
jgi:hypothetical protein